MESRIAPAGQEDSPTPIGTGFHLRQQSLQARVNEAAKALSEQGIRPTVTRIRAALGGGSPNDLAPALKQWREVVFPTLPLAAEAGPRTPPLPLQITDLVYELWQRAVGAALVELRGGPSAREVVTRTVEAQSLRQQVSDLRDRLERESLAYGELRAVAARHEALAREAVTRAHEGEVRERHLLRELGVLRQRMAELEAALAMRGDISSRSRRGVVRKRNKREGRKMRRARAAGGSLSRQFGGRSGKRNARKSDRPKRGANRKAKPARSKSR